MVKLYYIVILILFRFSAFADVSIESSINQNIGHIHFPVVGTITVTLDKNAVIDSSSFSMEGKPLETSLIKNVNLANDTTIAIYSFSLPPQEVGLHALPSISVKVDNKTYHSFSSSYSVVDSVPTISSTNVKSSPLLKLEAFVKGSTQLYPGERTTLVYRLSFNRSIDLTKSELPFIHTNAFIKVGDAQIQEEQKDTLTIQEIAQVVEATTIGSYSIGPSFVEGYAYQINLLGKKEYEDQLLRAEAPAIEITVQLFSTDNQPTSFNEAIGRIKAELTVLSSTNVQVGQSIQLMLAVSGISNLSDFHLPPLICQPGFSGIFYFDELAMKTEMEQEVKKIYFELRLLNSLAFEIPSIELASFDPDSKSYHVVHTNPIPLTFKETLQENTEQFVHFPSQISPSEDRLNGLFLQKNIPLQLANVKLTLSNAKLPFYQRSWILFFIPLSVLLLAYQYRLRKLYIQSRANRLKSLIYLQEASKDHLSDQNFLKLLEKALLWKLVELGYYQSPILNMSLLPKTEVGNKFYHLLQLLQTLQYGSNQSKIDRKNLLWLVNQLMTS